MPTQYKDTGKLLSAGQTHVVVSEEMVEQVLKRLPSTTVIEIEQTLRAGGAAQAALQCFLALCNDETITVKRSKRSLLLALRSSSSETLKEAVICMVADQGKELVLEAARLGVEGTLVVNLLHGNLAEITTNILPHLTFVGLGVGVIAVVGTVVTTFLKKGAE